MEDSRPLWLHKSIFTACTNNHLDQLRRSGFPEQSLGEKTESGWNKSNRGKPQTQMGTNMFHA